MLFIIVLTSRRSPDVVKEDTNILGNKNIGHKFYYSNSIRSCYNITHDKTLNDLLFKKINKTNQLCYIENVVGNDDID